MLNCILNFSFIIVLICNENLQLRSEPNCGLTWTMFSFQNFTVHSQVLYVFISAKYACMLKMLILVNISEMPQKCVYHIYFAFMPLACKINNKCFKLLLMLSSKYSFHSTCGES